MEPADRRPERYDNRRNALPSSISPKPNARKSRWYVTRHVTRLGRTVGLIW